MLLSITDNKFYVYVHFDDRNVPFYIGKGRGGRVSENSRNRHSTYWSRYVGKHGFKDYELLEENVDEKTALELEIYWIAQFKAWGFKLVNLTNGGDGMSGYKHSTESKLKMSNLQLGKTHSEKTKYLLAQRMLGRKLDLETRSKMSKSHRAKQKPVLQFDLQGIFIKEWSCPMDAVKTFNKNGLGHVSNCCSGKRKTAFGFIWKYKEPVSAEAL